MTCAATRRLGKRKLALAAFTLFPLAPALATAPATNQADVHLRTDIDTMAVQIGQGAPLPPGGCNPGYTWHTTYGGCRIAQTQSESTQCPVGQIGTRERNRVAYVLQANPGDIAYDGWSDWKEDCRPMAPLPSPAQVAFTVLKRPSGVSCRFTEFKVRANYPDGTAAIGVPLKWTVVWRGALSRYETLTDSRGEASTTATGFDGNMNIRVRVSFGTSSQEIRGICIGGT